MKIRTYVALLCLLAACQQAAEQSSVSREPDSPSDTALVRNESDAVNDTLGKPAFEEFSAFLASLPCDRPEQFPIVAQEFKTMLSEASPALRERAFVQVWYFYFNLLEQLNVQFARQQSYSAEASSLPRRLERLSGPSLRDSLQRQGFTVRSVEGAPYIAEYPDYLAQHFYALLSPRMQRFLDQYQEEVRQGFSEDATLVISPRQVGERLVFWERFSEQHPDFPLRADIRLRTRSYQFALLEGTDNTPAFDYESGQLTLEFEQTYDYLIGKYPDTDLGRLLKAYQRTLLENDWRKTEAIEQFLRRMRDQGTGFPEA